MVQPEAGNVPRSNEPKDLARVGSREDRETRIEVLSRKKKTLERRKDAHLALKILHNVQKMVVNVWFVVELHLDRVQIAQRVCHVQRAIIPVIAVGSDSSSVCDSRRVNISAAL